MYFYSKTASLASIKSVKLTDDLKNRNLLVNEPNISNVQRIVPNLTKLLEDPIYYSFALHRMPDGILALHF